EILEGQHGPAARMSWSDFRDYHERHCLSAMKPKSVDAYVCSLNVYERFHKPERLSDVTTARVTAWQTHLRTEGKSDATIANYTRHLKAVLRWAHAQGLLAVVPKLAMPKRAKAAKVMKGRPITAEEFERMLAAVPNVVVQKSASKTGGGAKAATDSAAVREKARYAKAVIESWNFYLHGLWWSGLRLRESLALEWTSSTPGALVVDFTGRRPMLRIPGESEKGGMDRLLPIAPEFAELLLQIPGAERHGRVFKLLGKRYADARMEGDWVSRVVCQIGRKARVVVDQRERRLVVDSRAAKRKPKPGKAKGDEAKGNVECDDPIKLKYASAHDLRRAFGLRWSARVMPAVLQQLMRHESIETTMRYYVGRDADAMADALWEAVNGKPRSTESANIGSPSRDSTSKAR
ncbi:MAG TPA: site-specific integrase, partial [Lacipirellulaceae bacterium]